MVKIVALTGAGISAESGLATFRDSDGLWANHRVEDVCTPEAFSRNPQLVYDFYNARRLQLQEVEPNEGHKALVNIERNHKLTLVTQNVDDLHERAGSKHVIHMHGELLSTRCLSCHQIYSYAESFDGGTPCKFCDKCTLRPHIVFFGETPLFMDKIYHAISECDIFITIGTSGMVYPAAGLVQEAKKAGARCIEFNLEPSAQHGYFDESYMGLASSTLADWSNKIHNE